MVQISPLQAPRHRFGTIFFIFCTITYPLLMWCMVLPPLTLLLSFPLTTIAMRRKIQFLVVALISWYDKLEIWVIETIFGVKFCDYSTHDAILNTDENALLICNHPTLYDWMFLWGFLGKYSKLHKFCVILKHDLHHLPFLGYCIQSAMYLFLARDWVLDQSTILSLTDYYKRYHQHYQLLLFPEGTTIGPHSIDKADDFVAKQHITPFKSLLPPRTTGFVHLLLQLTSLKSLFSQHTDLPLAKQREKLCNENIKNYVDVFSTIDAIYNFTIAYSSSYQIDLATGYVPTTVHTHLERIDIKSCVEQIMQVSLHNDAKYFTSQSYNPFSVENQLTFQNHETGEATAAIATAELGNSVDIDKTNNQALDDMRSPKVTTGKQYELNLATMTPEQIFREQASVWLLNKWYEKDAMLTDYYDRLHKANGVVAEWSWELKHKNSSNSTAFDALSQKPAEVPLPETDQLLPIKDARKDVTHPNKTNNNAQLKLLLLDPQTYMVQTKPQTMIQWKHAFGISLYYLSVFYFMFAIPPFGFWVLGYSILSVIILSVVKIPFFPWINKAAISYETRWNTALSKQHVSSSSTNVPLHSDALLVQQFYSDNRIEDIEKYPSNDELLKTNQSHSTSSLTPRQVRIITRQQTRERVIKQAIQRGAPLKLLSLLTSSNLDSHHQDLSPDLTSKPISPNARTKKNSRSSAPDDTIIADHFIHTDCALNSAHLYAGLFFFGLHLIAFFM